MSMVKVVCYILWRKVLEIRGERAGSEQGKREKEVRKGRRMMMNPRRLEQ